MTFEDQSFAANEMLKLEGEQRWLIYQRLKQLGIICSCQAYQPLQINIENGTTLLQVWSVARQMILPRSQLVPWLERCWNLDATD